MQRVFVIKEPLTGDNADAVYDKCNEILKGHSARTLMEMFHVKAICTTDDPVDDLRWHRQLARDDTFSIKVLPAFRPDQALNPEKPGFAAYIRRLGEAVGRELNGVEDVIGALEERIEFFAENGCVAADHGMDCCVFAQPDPAAANAAFRAAMEGRCPGREQGDAYKTLVTIACAKQYAQKNMVMQIHFGCLRNINRPMFDKLGADIGCDAVNPRSGVEQVAPLLNAFVENEGLPKMVLYSLDPGDNTALVTIMACFQGGGMAGKLQHGSAWWFNDHLPGIRRQLTDLACNGVLGQFIGMLTDSRSFLSYTRHEYFRRILCEVIGQWVESGQYPNEEKQLTKLVTDLCFHNTNTYFGFGLERPDKEM